MRTGAPRPPTRAMRSRARCGVSSSASGLRAVFACELEFYLLREEPGDGAPRLVPAGGGRRGERAKIDAYGLTRLDDLAPLFDEVYAAARAQGLPAETLMSEYAPGQFEITLAHRRDALRAVDEAIAFKRLLRGVAAKHGCIATFMAKPFAALAGSGMHLHVSLEDAAGRNVFAADDPAGSEACRHAIGGLRATLAESLLAFAPNANSYRRFRSQSYAPTAPTWGVNNRSVSLRVPAGPPDTRHVEHRDVRRRRESLRRRGGRARRRGARTPAPHRPRSAGGRQRLCGHGGHCGRGDRRRRRRGRLPATWHEAIERAAASAFLADALGAGFLDVFLAIKRQECDRFMAEVTELDYAWYLRSV